MYNSDSKKIVHFYHLYADYDWKFVFMEHIVKLRKSRLWENMDKMVIGLINPSEDDAAHIIRRIVPDGVEVEVFETKSGWEDFTLNKMLTFSKEVENKNTILFYAHGKGVSYTDQSFQESWRDSLLFNHVIKWQQPAWYVSEGYEVAGFWLLKNPGDSGGRTFSGNWFWSKASHVETLDYLNLDESNRLQAETWVADDLPLEKIANITLDCWIYHPIKQS